MRGHFGEQFSGLNKGVRQRNALSGSSTKFCKPLLRLSLTGGEVLNDLLLPDANLSEPLEDFVHGVGEERSPGTIKNKKNKKQMSGEEDRLTVILH